MSEIRKASAVQTPIFDATFKAEWLDKRIKKLEDDHLDARNEVTTNIELATLFGGMLGGAALLGLAGYGIGRLRTRGPMNYDAFLTRSIWGSAGATAGLFGGIAGASIGTGSLVEHQHGAQLKAIDSRFDARIAAYKRERSSIILP
jgi:hypothetical protein